MPSRGLYAPYSIRIVGRSSEGYPPKPNSTRSTHTYRRSRSLNLSLSPTPSSQSFSVSLSLCLTHTNKDMFMQIRVMCCVLLSSTGDSGFIQTWLWGRCGAAGWWPSSLLGLWSDRHWSHPQQQWVWWLNLFSSLQSIEKGQLDIFVLSWSCFTSHPGGFAESDWLLGISDSHLQRCFTECCYYASWKGWPLPIIMCCLVWMRILMVKDLRATL